MQRTPVVDCSERASFHTFNQIRVQQEGCATLCIRMLRLRNYSTGFRLNLVLVTALKVATSHEVQTALTEFLGTESLH
jgi:hypothetical protein